MVFARDRDKNSMHQLTMNVNKKFLCCCTIKIPSQGTVVDKVHGKCTIEKISAAAFFRRKVFLQEKGTSKLFLTPRLRRVPKSRRAFISFCYWWVPGPWPSKATLSSLRLFPNAFWPVQGHASRPLATFILPPWPLSARSDELLYLKHVVLCRTIHGASVAIVLYKRLWTAGEVDPGFVVLDI